MNVIPNGSGPVLGWQCRSAAARSRRTSDLLAQPAHAVGNAQALGLGLQLVEVDLLVRALNAARDPDDPAGAIAQPAQGFKQEGMALPAFEPAGQDEDQSVRVGVQLGADLGAGAGTVDRLRGIDRTVQNLGLLSGKEPGDAGGGMVAVGHDEVGTDATAQPVGPVGALGDVMQPEDAWNSQGSRDRGDDGIDP